MIRNLEHVRKHFFVAKSQRFKPLPRKDDEGVSGRYIKES